MRNTALSLLLLALTVPACRVLNFDSSLEITADIYTGELADRAPTGLELQRIYDQLDSLARLSNHSANVAQLFRWVDVLVVVNDKACAVHIEEVLRRIQDDPAAPPGVENENNRMVAEENKRIVLDKYRLQ